MNNEVARHAALPWLADLVNDFFEGFEVAGFLDEGVEPVLAVAAHDVFTVVTTGEDNFCV